jgi:hypothetical protein
VSKQRLHLPLNTQEFTMYTALNQAQLMRQQLEDDARLDKETIAKMPDKFKLASNWKIFSEAIETYLSQLLGSGRVPLSYVIRRDDTPDPNAVYDNEIMPEYMPLLNNWSWKAQVEVIYFHMIESLMADKHGWP